MLWDDDGYGSPEGGPYPFDPAYPMCAYFYGLALSDGSIRQNERNSGAVSIEIRTSDAAPLLTFDEALPWKSRITTRERKSPFGDVISSTTAYVCHDIDLRSQLVALGFPIGAKSRICAPPSATYDETAFWRGYLDGDGSLGITAKGLPFVSLVTISPLMVEAYLDFVERVAGVRPSVSPNKRDGAWNIMLMRQRAVDVVRALYRPGDLAVPRKAEKARQILDLNWEQRPDGRRTRWSKAK